MIKYEVDLPNVVRNIKKGHAGHTRGSYETVISGGSFWMIVAASGCVHVMLTLRRLVYCLPTE